MLQIRSLQTFLESHEMLQWLHMNKDLKVLYYQKAHLLLSWHQVDPNSIFAANLEGICFKLQADVSFWRFFYSKFQQQKVKRYLKFH
jgi:hypothetical protein